MAMKNFIWKTYYLPVPDMYMYDLTFSQQRKLTHKKCLIT